MLLDSEVCQTSRSEARSVVDVIHISQTHHMTAFVRRKLFIHFSYFSVPCVFEGFRVARLLLRLRAALDKSSGEMSEHSHELCHQHDPRAAECLPQTEILTTHTRGTLFCTLRKAVEASARGNSPEVPSMKNGCTLANVANMNLNMAGSCTTPPPGSFIGTVNWQRR